jgi:RNA 2',3'-cyclic 3'-phosphodiesterase
MRLFFAIAFPADTVRRIEQVQRALRERVGDDGVRWTGPDQYHYTLKFLGEQSLSRAQTAVELATAIAEEFEPFALTLSGVGAFPNTDRPSILWLGASGGADRVATLASRLDEVLSRRGFPRERKPVSAHLTLARIKTYAGEAAAAKLLKSVPQAECGDLLVDRFFLMRSTMQPAGSIYEVVREFQFAKRGA